MNILVTGGTGFIGSHLVEYLLTKGHDVRCLVKQDDDTRYISNKGVEFVYGDICDSHSVEEAAKGVEYVYHLAAVQRGSVTQEEFYRVNASGTRNILEACYKNAPNMRKFVHVSSISAVGPRNVVQALTEDSPCRPVDHYGESKLSGEEVAIEYMSKLPLVIVRPPLVYGPRDMNQLTVLRYMKMVTKGFYFIRGSGKRYTSIIFVKDLVEGLITVAHNDASTGQKYFLCDELPTSYDVICELTASALKRKAIKITVPSILIDAKNMVTGFYKNNDKRKARHQNSNKYSLHWVCDGSKAKRELGYQTRTLLPDGIYMTVNWYRENGWL